MDDTISTEALHARWLQSLDARSQEAEQQLERLRFAVGLLLVALIAFAFYCFGKGRPTP